MDIYTKCLEFVPQKLSSIRFSQPWVTSKTKRICRKKKRLYNKARNSGLTRDWNDYLNVKKLARHECRAAYHEYVSHLIDPHTNNKKFWSHIKSCHRLLCLCNALPPIDLSLLVSQTEQLFIYMFLRSHVPSY